MSKGDLISSLLKWIITIILIIFALTVWAGQAYSDTRVYAQEPETKIDINKLLTYETPKLAPFPQGNPNPIPVPVIVKQIAYAAPVQSTTLEEWLYRLRLCESGGNYQTNTGNGYYGAYQFLISTWNNVAKKVRPDLVGIRPDLASPQDQDYMIIQNTLLSAGLVTQNPGCYSKMGLSNKPPS